MRLMAVCCRRETTLRWSGAWGWLNCCGTGLLLEDRIVAQALTLRLDAVSAGRVLFVALENVSALISGDGSIQR